VFHQIAAFITQIQSSTSCPLLSHLCRIAFRSPGTTFTIRTLCAPKKPLSAASTQTRKTTPPNLFQRGPVHAPRFSRGHIRRPVYAGMVLPGPGPVHYDRRFAGPPLMLPAGRNRPSAAPRLACPVGNQFQLAFHTALPVPGFRQNVFKPTGTLKAAANHITSGPVVLFGEAISYSHMAGGSFQTLLLPLAQSGKTNFSSGTLFPPPAGWSVFSLADLPTPQARRPFGRCVWYLPKMLFRFCGRGISASSSPNFRTKNSASPLGACPRIPRFGFTDLPAASCSFS